MLNIRNQVAKRIKNDNKNEIKTANSETQLTIIYLCIPVIPQVWEAVCRSMPTWSATRTPFWKHCGYFHTREVNYNINDIYNPFGTYLWCILVPLGISGSHSYDLTTNIKQNSQQNNCDQNLAKRPKMDLGLFEWRNFKLRCSLLNYDDTFNIVRVCDHICVFPLNSTSGLNSNHILCICSHLAWSVCLGTYDNRSSWLFDTQWHQLSGVQTVAWFS